MFNTKKVKSISFKDEIKRVIKIHHHIFFFYNNDYVFY